MCKLSLSGWPLVTPASTFHRLWYEEAPKPATSPSNQLWRQVKRTDGGQLDRLVSHAGLCCAEGMCGCGCGGHQAAGSRLRRNTHLHVKSGSLLALLWEGTINGWFSRHLVTNPHLKNCPHGFDVVRPTLMAGGTFRQQLDKKPSSGERSSRPLLPMWLCSE